jgi:hypothetical protein
LKLEEDNFLLEEELLMPKEELLEELKLRL